MIFFSNSVKRKDYFHAICALNAFNIYFYIFSLFRPSLLLCICILNERNEAKSSIKRCQMYYYFRNFMQFIEYFMVILCVHFFTLMNLSHLHTHTHTLNLMNNAIYFNTHAFVPKKTILSFYSSHRCLLHGRNHKKMIQYTKAN